MSLWKIAWRSLQQRALASTLTGISMALGVTLVVAVLIAFGVVTDYFQRNQSLHYNVIVGPKGGKLQLVLNSVYHLSQPVENLPWTVYQDFLPASNRYAKTVDGSRQDGKWVKKYPQLLQDVIPFCLGDNYQGYRVVGTVPEIFELPYSAEEDRYEFADGENFEADEFFTGVLGSEVARRTDLQVGDTFQPTHGIAETSDGKKHDAFEVVGILKPTGTPNDRAVFVNMEGFFLLEGHAKSRRDYAAERDKAEPLPEEEREVTSLLVRTNADQMLNNIAFQTAINEGQEAMAVAPIREISTLSQLFIGPLKWLLLGLSFLIIVVSSVSILVSIYNSMNDRKRDIAVMRALGAQRTTVMQIILLESVMLSLLAGIAGWLLAHLALWLLNPYIADLTGITLGWFEFVSLGQLVQELAGRRVAALDYVPVELILIPILVLLATIVGYLPARNAYNTDVAEALN